jgi:hypothetical protein
VTKNTLNKKGSDSVIVKKNKEKDRKKGPAKL